MAATGVGRFLANTRTAASSWAAAVVVEAVVGAVGAVVAVVVLRLPLCPLPARSSPPESPPSQARQRGQQIHRCRRRSHPQAI